MMSFVDAFITFAVLAGGAGDSGVAALVRRTEQQIRANGRDRSKPVDLGALGGPGGTPMSDRLSPAVAVAAFRSGLARALLRGREPHHAGAIDVAVSRQMRATRPVEHPGPGDNNGRRWQLCGHDPAVHEPDAWTVLGRLLLGGLAGLPSCDVLTDALRCVLGLAHGHRVLADGLWICKVCNLAPPVSCVAPPSAALTRRDVIRWLPPSRPRRNGTALAHHARAAAHKESDFDGFDSFWARAGRSGRRSPFRR